MEIIFDYERVVTSNSTSSLYSQLGYLTPN